MKTGRPARLLRWLLVPLLTGCASGSATLPYPAFVQADDLPDAFIAGLPGIMAKQFIADPVTRSASHRLLLPPGWSGTIGASPGKTVELFVVAGDVTLGGIALTSGGYAYVPSQFTGSSISTRGGAVVLYFLDDPRPGAVIQTPLILDSNAVDWRPEPDDPRGTAILERELRRDPGTGARSWLLRIATGSTQGWRKSSAPLEGYLLSGSYRHSECVDGTMVSGDYAAGGYFYRPAGAVNGGPKPASAESVWFLRRPGTAVVETVTGCSAN